MSDVFLWDWSYYKMFLACQVPNEPETESDAEESETETESEGDEDDEDTVGKMLPRNFILRVVLP